MSPSDKAVRQEEEQKKRLQFEEHLAGFARVESCFYPEPEGLPADLPAEMWDDVAPLGELSTPEGLAPLDVETEVKVIHDARHIVIRAVCGEPDMGSIWTRRSAGQGRLDLDDSVEIALDPYHAHGFHWSFIVTPSGETEVVLPVGAVAKPDLKVSVERGDSSWSFELRIPMVDIGLEGDLRGTPINGDAWGLSVVRRRREAVKGDKAGLRQVGSWGGSSVPIQPEEFGHLVFVGGRSTRPIEFTRYEAGGFGVNEICVSFEGGGIPENVEVELSPAPAKRLRSKDISRCKFRVARPGLYRYSARLPYTPPPEPTDAELAKLEAEAGRELGDDELAELLAERAGTPEYVAGLSFVLPDLWSQLEDMEDRVSELRKRLEAEGLVEGLAGSISDFQDLLVATDRYRAPHTKDLLGADRVKAVKSKYEDVLAQARKTLLRHGRISIASPYIAEGQWYQGVLRARTRHSYGGSTAEEMCGILKGAGLHFCSFADVAEGGGQDGDGQHDWNGDGSVSSAARRIEGLDRSVPEDRGREAFVIDYSQPAADQGKPWVAENWKLSQTGDFVVLRAVEVGPHSPAVCVGTPAGGLPAGTAGSYQEINRTQTYGGVAFMCDVPGDMRELPSELDEVLGVNAPPDAWDRLLASGRQTLLFPADAIDGPLPERYGRVVVKAESLSEEAVLASLRRGSFFITSGPEITSIEAEGDTLKVTTSEPCQIFFRGQGGQVLGGSFGVEAKYRFSGHEKYVRAVCLADVLEDGSRVEAVTQAFYISDALPTSPIADAEWTIGKPIDRSGEVEPVEAEDEEDEAEEEAEE